MVTNYNLGGLYIREISMSAGWHDDVRTEIVMESNSPLITQLLMNTYRGMDAPAMMKFTSREEEYECVWCGSANPISHRHCSQCGGHRGVILTGI